MSVPICAAGIIAPIIPNNPKTSQKYCIFIKSPLLILQPIRLNLNINKLLKQPEVSLVILVRVTVSIYICLHP